MQEIMPVIKNEYFRKNVIKNLPYRVVWCFSRLLPSKLHGVLLVKNGGMPLIWSGRLGAWDGLGKKKPLPLCVLMLDGVSESVRSILGGGVFTRRLESRSLHCMKRLSVDNKFLDMYFVPLYLKQTNK